MVVGIQKIRQLHVKRIAILYLIASIGILTIYFSPYLIWGQDCLIQISDNLDANIPYYKIIAQNAHELGWGYPIVPQVMNGLPKSSFLTQWNLTYFLFYIFPSFTAYVIHLVLIALIAFLGMIQLLKSLTNVQTRDKLLIIYGVALCFSVLPFYPSAGISIAGQPLLLSAFININRGNKSFWNFLIIILYPFYSSLIFGGVFYFIILIFWGTYKILYQRQYLQQFIVGFTLLFLSYIFTEHELIFSYLGNQDQSIATGQGVMFTNSLKECFLNTYKLLVYGFPAHAKIFQFPVILLSIVVALLTSVFKKSSWGKNFIVLLLLTLLISLASAFYSWEVFSPLKNSFTFLKSFDFSRFSFLLPLLFYLLFFYSLFLISTHFVRIGSFFVLLLIVLQLGYNFKRNSNNRTLYYKFQALTSPNPLSKTDLTYSQYYSEELFSRIKDYIGCETHTFRVLGLGIEPGVLIHNGFYTLDGYNSNYPIAYKNIFRKIIEKEIAKSNNIMVDFDYEGSLCYLHSAELKRGKCYTKNDSTSVTALEINTDIIKELGGEYIISTVRIMNASSINLRLLHTFVHDASPYIIHLYKV